MRRLRRLSVIGLTLLLGAPFKAAAQNDSGTLEVLVEDPSGPRSPDGTPALTFETRTVSNLERVDIGPGRSVTDPGQRIGTGSGRVITPTVTVSELVTEASVYPQKFRHVTKDAQGRIWATAEEPRYGLYVFADSTWRRVSFPSPQGVQDLGRDAQGRVWVVGNFDRVYRISGEYPDGVQRLPGSRSRGSVHLRGGEWRHGVDGGVQCSPRGAEFGPVPALRRARVAAVLGCRRVAPLFIDRRDGGGQHRHGVGQARL